MSETKMKYTVSYILGRLVNELKCYEPIAKQDDPEYVEGLLTYIIGICSDAMMDFRKTQFTLNDPKWINMLGNCEKYETNEEG